MPIRQIYGLLPSKVCMHTNVMLRYYFKKFKGSLEGKDSRFISL